MEPFVAGLLEKVVIGAPQVRENLTLFPLTASQPGEAAGYLLLDEALAAGVLEVGEVSEAGSVNTILVKNTGDQPVLILDGEELVGAKQNRMVNATTLVPPRTEIKMGVSCVERGRWSYTAERFEQSAVFGYSTLRSQKAAQVSESLRFDLGFQADQGALWAEIDRKHARMGSRSDTDALHDAYRDRQADLQRYLAGLEPQPGQTGVACFINGRFACLDLFDAPETLAKVWTKLITSYAMDALENRKEEKEDDVPNLETVLNAARAGQWRSYPSAGRGTDVRVRAAGVVGAGLVDDGRLVHLSLFGPPADEGAGEQMRISRPSVRRFSY